VAPRTALTARYDSDLVGRRFLPCLVLAVAVSIAAAGGASHAGAAADPTLKVGYAFAFDGTSTGDRVAFSRLNRTKGISSELTDLRTAQAAAAALLHGDVDMISTGLQVSIQAIQQGAPLKAILVARQVNEQLFVSNTTTIAGLRGKRVSFQAPKTEGEAFTKLLLKRGGLSYSDITPTPIIGSESRMTALLAGKIDATFLNYVDWLQLKRAKPRTFHVLYRMRRLMKYSAMLAWFVTDSYLQSHKPLLQRFVTGMTDAYDWLYTPAGKRAFVARAKSDTLKGVPSSIINEMYKNYKQVGFWPHRRKPVTKAQWQSRTQFWVRNGIVDADAPFNRLWNLTFWRTAAKTAPKLAPAKKKPKH
jgi:ABC-type nitrate/sulfonate/bicarbonate transport system substrate-binding protein